MPIPRYPSVFCPYPIPTVKVLTSPTGEIFCNHASLEYIYGFFLDEHPSSHLYVGFYSALQLADDGLKVPFNDLREAAISANHCNNSKSKNGSRVLLSDKGHLEVVKNFNSLTKVVYEFLKFKFFHVRICYLKVNPMLRQVLKFPSKNPTTGFHGKSFCIYLQLSMYFNADLRHVQVP